MSNKESIFRKIGTRIISTVNKETLYRMGMKAVSQGLKLIAEVIDLELKEMGVPAEFKVMPSEDKDDEPERARPPL